jgi:hypothetical protein
MMLKSDVLAPRSAPARLRLVAAANERLAVSLAVGRALGLVLLRQSLLADLVVVVRHLASLRRLLFLG